MKKNLLMFFALAFVCHNLSSQQATVYTTAKDTDLRLTKTQVLKTTPNNQTPKTDDFIYLDSDVHFQTFLGMGGAITDASASVFDKLPAKSQEELLTAYYDKKKGIAYSFIRTSINSSDFSDSSYTYVDENDASLSTFNIKRDLEHKMPLIKKAMKAAGGKANVCVSPWSPPAWMKDNNDMLNGGKLLPQYYQSWANYYVKFIQAYEANGIPIWGLTIQNEPLAKQIWESCIYTAEEERDFLKNYLGPTLWSKGMKDKKVIVWDHNRDLMFQRASIILNDKKAAPYVWGVGYHWYEAWAGGEMDFKNEKLVKDAFPDVELVFTEGCVEGFKENDMENWRLGEKYGYSIINDLSCGTSTWMDWNILLDEKGGPNHVGNFCYAPIHADTKTGKLIYTNSYYYIGHVSKFIQPGAKRIASSSNKQNLLIVAFQNPDNSIAVVVMNKTAEDVERNLMFKNNSFTIKILPHSINTIILE